MDPKQEDLKKPAMPPFQMSELDLFDSLISCMQLGFKFSAADVERMIKATSSLPEEGIATPVVIDLRQSSPTDRRLLQRYIEQGYVEGCYGDSESFNEETFRAFIRACNRLLEEKAVGVIHLEDGALRFSFLLKPVST